MTFHVYYLYTFILLFQLKDISEEKCLLVRFYTGKLGLRNDISNIFHSEISVLVPANYN